MPLTPEPRRSWPIFGAVAAFYAVLAGILLWPCVLRGEAFLPAGQLGYLAPWSANIQPERRMQWNPLHYDSIGQYWVYRDFATRSILQGRLPLWNPYQMCGTPFVANNLSAVYYPGNLIHLVLGPLRAAGWNAGLHIVLAGLFMWLLLRAHGASTPSALIGGATFALSAWQVSWLHLAPFLTTACWLPALLLITFRLREAASALRMAALAATVGLVLLAGHLQIAFYVLGTAALYSLWLLGRRETAGAGRWSFVGAVIAAWALGVLVAAPQWLPSAELARYAHRTGGPTAEGYRAYVAYAAHPASLATLWLPDFFGNPSDAGGQYIGFSRGGLYYNYAEGAAYVGMLPLLLAGIGLICAWRSAGHARFAGALAAVSLLVGVGTLAAAVLYFLVPGFSRSGSPGRVLVLWTFAASWLASVGYDSIARGSVDAKLRNRAVSGVLVLGALFAAAATAACIGVLGGYPDVIRQTIGQAAIAALSVLIVLWLLPAARNRKIAAWSALALVCADLLGHGIGYNSTARAEALSAPQGLAAAVTALTGHDRVAPINSNWSFAGPAAVLPPNIATAWGLRDVQGYDSLLPGQYKGWLRSKLGADPSPPEVGNMVFLRQANTDVLDSAGVRAVVSLEPLSVPAAGSVQQNGLWLYERASPQGRARAHTDSGGDAEVRWLADDPGLVRLATSSPSPGYLELADQFWPGWHASVDGKDARIERLDGVFRKVAVPAGAHTVAFRYAPATTYVGLYLMCTGIGAVLCCACAGVMSRKNPSAGE